jgi:hypothetical protein
MTYSLYGFPAEKLRISSYSLHLLGLQGNKTYNFKFHMELSDCDSKWNPLLSVLLGLTYTIRFHLELNWFFERTFQTWFHIEPKSVPSV